METTKEFYEILNFIKKEIDKIDFPIAKDKFNKELIKSLILRNSETHSILNSLKERRKINDNNKNVFYVIKNNHKKSFKEIRTILEEISEFSIFYNEPKYVEKFNTDIYKRIKENLEETSKNIKLVTIMNGYLIL
jgi:hypothetical protein